MRGGTECLPHYFLGEALYNLNDCAGAVAEWAISEQLPFVRTQKEFSGFMDTGYRTCAMRGILLPAEFNAQSAVASQEVEDAVALVERVSKLGNGDAWRQELRDQYSRIGQDLTTSQTRLAVGMRSRSAADFNEARAAAGRVVTALKAFEAALNVSIRRTCRPYGSRPAKWSSPLPAPRTTTAPSKPSIRSSLRRSPRRARADATC